MSTPFSFALRLQKPCMPRSSPLNRVARALTQGILDHGAQGLALGACDVFGFPGKFQRQANGLFTAVPMTHFIQLV